MVKTGACLADGGAYGHDVRSYKLFDSRSEPVFDRLSALAASILNVPMAMINFIDRAHVWGGQEDHDPATLGGHADSLCSVALLKDANGVFSPIAEEMCFISSPWMAGEYGLKFYAATPIMNNEGFHLGSVCVLDQESRDFTAADRSKLECIAVMVRDEMNRKMGLSLI